MQEDATFQPIAETIAYERETAGVAGLTDLADHLDREHPTVAAFDDDVHLDARAIPEEREGEPPAPLLLVASPAEGASTRRAVTM